MRFILVALIWLLLIGGLSYYIHLRDARILPDVQARVAVQLEAADYALEITPTFGAELDPFALQEEGQEPATLMVRLGGEDIYRGDSPLARGATLRIAPLTGLVVGNNEFYLEASPAYEESHLAHALRVRLLRGGVTLFDRTLWSEAGAKVSGTIDFTLEKSAEADHAH